MLPRAPIESQVHRDPFFSLRRPSRSILSRFLAHLLVRLLIIAPLPANLQAVAVLFPVSMLWPLVAPEQPAEPTSAACVLENRVRGFDQEIAPLVGGEGPQAVESHQGSGLAYGGIASDRLYYAKARYYEPTIGRFISQDTFLGNVDDPPSLHRYFYANANPTRYVDPTGHYSGLVTYQSARIAEWKREAEELEARKAEHAQRCAGGCFTAAPPPSVARGAVYYGIETALEFASPIPLGLSDPDTSFHPLASHNQSSMWITGANQQSEDYAAFKAKYGRGAQVVEGAAVMKLGGKPGKVIGAAIILGAIVFGGNNVPDGVQVEEGNLGPNGQTVDALPADHDNAREPVRAGERTTLEDFRARSVPGDKLEGHELVQHAKLKNQGIAGKERLSTPASRENPILVLEREKHIEVSKEQLVRGTKDMPIVQSLRENARILLDKSATTREVLAKFLKDAYEHAKKWKVK